MFENQEYHQVKISKEKPFGITMSVVFLIIGIYPLYFDNSVQEWSLIVSFLFLAIALIRPQFLKIPNFLWFKLGILLGTLISPVILFIIFFGVITPTAMITKVFKKDLINQKFYKEMKSYWVNRKDSIGNMKNQY